VKFEGNFHFFGAYRFQQLAIAQVCHLLIVDRQLSA
jgi:hypothetical protein